MNMISELRQRVRQHGAATITAEEYDQLQAEWITRTGAEEMVAAEREACAKVCDKEQKQYELADWLSHACGAEACAEEIRMRSND